MPGVVHSSVPRGQGRAATRGAWTEGRQNGWKVCKIGQNGMKIEENASGASKGGRQNRRQKLLNYSCMLLWRLKRSSAGFFGRKGRAGTCPPWTLLTLGTPLALQPWRCHQTESKVVVENRNLFFLFNDAILLCMPLLVGTWQLFITVQSSTEDWTVSLS
jgi:hypothetical protein